MNGGLANERLVSGGAVIARARRRAGLSQSELGTKLGTTRSAVCRWEHGRVDPSFGAVERAVSACGSRLADVLAEPDPDTHDLALLETSLGLTISARLQRLIDFAEFVESGRK